MKKVIFMFMLVVSVSASDVYCDVYEDKLDTDIQLFKFSIDSGSTYRINKNVNRTILSAEKALAYCGKKWKRYDAISTFRKDIIAIRDGKN